MRSVPNAETHITRFSAQTHQLLLCLVPECAREHVQVPVRRAEGSG